MAKRSPIAGIRHLLAAGVVVLATASASRATIAIEWLTLAAILDPANPGQPVPDGSIAQLIWSPDAVMGLLDPGAPLTPGGNDFLLVQSVTSLNGFIAYGEVTVSAETWASFPTPWNVPDGDWDGAPLDGLADAMVYTRVFNSDAPGIGSWYTDVSGTLSARVFPLLDQDPDVGGPPGAQRNDVTDGQPFLLNRQVVIPEPGPGTLAALGLGLVGAARWWRGRVSRGKCRGRSLESEGPTLVTP